eukprot:TRINITY_DN49774_c0_g1_i1.p1 TRINITY_DN49774_c0_g1~~TRINITY_DN49774_c0_g1_i1.p1  ORF type:complete len:228 (+),score=20.00 TRINITY_DN49774_c0_g1_i1:349-1032(+)
MSEAWVHFIFCISVLPLALMAVSAYRVEDLWLRERTVNGVHWSDTNVKVKGLREALERVESAALDEQQRANQNPLWGETFKTSSGLLALSSSIDNGLPTTLNEDHNNQDLATNDQVTVAAIVVPEGNLPAASCCEVSSMTEIIRLSKRRRNTVSTMADCGEAEGDTGFMQQLTIGQSQQQNMKTQGSGVFRCSSSHGEVECSSFSSIRNFPKAVITEDISPGRVNEV